jgi:carboxymethylenebutenolidase
MRLKTSMWLKTWAVAVAAVVAMQLTGTARASGEERRETFKSGGTTISVDWFGAAGGADKAPAIVMLHGADGLTRAERYREGARRIAAGGYHVAFVHYLDRTGEKRASFGTIMRNFDPWLATVRDSVTWIARHPGVDPHRVGIVGISLGATLGLAAAGQDPRVKALVEYFGPMPQGIVTAGASLPPTLILHGAADPVVPVANAHALENLLRSQGTAHEVKIYPGQGHGFYGAAQDDADRRVAAFLDRHLGDADGRPRQASAPAGQAYN